MIPSTLLPSEPKTVPVPRPRGFRGVVGVPHAVQLTHTLYKRQRGNTAARASGLRYEEKAQRWLEATLGERYWAAPEIRFRDDSGFRCCIPDGLYIYADMITIFEIKIRHLPEAWWQLRRLYEPVLRKWREGKVKLVEVVQSFDPAMPFPEPVEHIIDLKAWVEANDGTLGVFEWKP